MTIRILGVLLLAACAQACAVETAERRPVEVDSGTVQVDSGTSSPAPDAKSTQPDARATSTPDAGHPDALPAQGEASPDAAAPSAGDAGSALPDGGRADSEDMAPGSDGGTDAGSTAVCPDPSAPSCAAAQRAEDGIRATFAMPCSPGDKECGGVLEGHLVITYPIECVAGTWHLAGYWTSGVWVATHECSSHGCNAGAICAP